ncbi:MAG: tetratricopeptide repeat protein [Flavobacteriales bacterium]
MKPIHLLLILLTGLGLPGLAQDTKYGSTEAQQTACKEALSVYRSFRDQNNHADAFVNWKKACAVCPEKVEESIYVDGVKFFKTELAAAETAKDAALVAALQDSILALYDKRIALYPSTKSKPKNGCSVLERKVSDYMKFRSDDMAGANAMLRETIVCLESESSASTLNNFYQTSFKLLKSLQGDERRAKMEEMLTDYLWIMEFANAGLARATSEADEKAMDIYTKAMANIDEVFITLASCDEMVPVLERKLAASPDDFELKKKVLGLLTKKECTGNSLYLPIAEAVHAKEPAAASAYSLGMAYAKKEDLTKAFTYFEEAAELCTSCPEREAYLMKAGLVASVLKRASTARAYAAKVLEINPKSADAYMLIGDAISGSASNCNDGIIGTRAAFWVAADYYNKARNLTSDGDLAEKITAKIATCARQYPSMDEIFTIGISAGSSFTMPSIGGCPCSGETTTVRVR